MKYSVKIINFREFSSNTLRGFLSVKLIDLNLEIYELTVHEQNGKRWIGLPGKPQIDKDRNIVLGSNGKPAYTPILKFSTKEAGMQFSDAILAALDAEAVAAK